MGLGQSTDLTGISGGSPEADLTPQQVGARLREGLHAYNILLASRVAEFMRAWGSSHQLPQQPVVQLVNNGHCFVRVLVREDENPTASIDSRAEAPSLEEQIKTDVLQGDPLDVKVLTFRIQDEDDDLFRTYLNQAHSTIVTPRSSAA